MTTPVPLSIKTYYEPLPYSTLIADDPVDTGHVWTLIDNAAHFADEAFVYRINYVDPIGMPFRSTELPGTLQHARIYVQARMPVTWSRRKAFYPSYEIRIGMHTPVSGVQVNTWVTSSIVVPGTPPPRTLSKASVPS